MFNMKVFIQHLLLTSVFVRNDFLRRYGHFNNVGTKLLSTSNSDVWWIPSRGLVASDIHMMYYFNVFP